MLAMAAAATTKVSRRLPNSMAWWSMGAAPWMGTKEPGWQLGQVTQPRPEPVTRTMEPDTVMPPWQSRRMSATMRCVFTEGPVVGAAGAVEC